MIGFRITSETGFNSRYWDHWLLDRDEVNLAATEEELHAAIPPGSSVEILIGVDNKIVVLGNGTINAQINGHTLSNDHAEVLVVGTGRHSLTIGNLKFQIEAIEGNPGDPM